MKVIVIGGGAAGTAAAWRARRGGADVSLLVDRAGATAIYSGALDEHSWNERASRADLSAEVLAFATALGTLRLSAQPVRVATDAGVIRAARGCDGALLDLAPLAGKKIAVADVPLAGWDAALLCNALMNERWTLESGTRFEIAPVHLLRSAAERRLSPFDLATLFDNASRVTALADALRAITGPDAFLLGPWLGTSAAVAEALRSRVGRPVGETASSPDGPAGPRFEQARDDLLASLGVNVVRARADRVELKDEGWIVSVGDTVLVADAVVLAVGGVFAGGIVLCPPTGESRNGAFDLSIDAPATLALDGHLLVGASSLHATLPSGGFGILERIGIEADGTRIAGSGSLFVAGDALAGRSRTMIQAIATGIDAAEGALSSG